MRPVRAVVVAALWASAVLAFPGRAEAARGQYDVPAAACTADGDSAPAIEEFLATVPNESVVTFPRDAMCRVERTVDLGVPPAGASQRTDTTYDLRGATIFREVEPSCQHIDDCNGPIVAINLVNAVTLQGGSVKGGLDVDGLPQFDATREHDHGIAVHGSVDVTLFGLHVSNVSGDCVDVDKQKKDVSANVRVIGTPGAPFTCEITGRQGVSANAVTGLRVQGVTFDRIASTGVDLEPRRHGYIDTALVKENRFGWMGYYAIAGIGASETWKRIAIEDNVQTDADHVGEAFLRAGNSFDRGPLEVSGNRIRNRIQVNHILGTASGNTLVAGPGGPRCMFELFNDPPFEVASSNRHPAGVQLTCALEGKIAAGGIERKARKLLKLLIPVAVVLLVVVVALAVWFRRRRSRAPSGEAAGS